MQKKLKLSIILCSRNDNYCGNSVERLTVALNHLGKAISTINKSDCVEVIVSDWGSVVPLQAELDDKLCKEIKKIIKFIHIPTKKTEKFKTSFSEVHALNVAAKNARGVFVGRIDQDTLVGASFLKWFFEDKISKDKVYFSGRRDLSKKQTSELMEEDTLSYLSENGSKINKWNNGKKIDVFYNKAVGIFLVPTTLYKKVRGYDEINIFYNHMEVEFIKRLKSLCEIVNLGKIVDFDFYHLFHEERVNLQENKFPILFDIKRIRPNDSKWGEAKPSVFFSLRLRCNDFKYFIWDKLLKVRNKIIN